jgi:Aspartate/tyrosine/aromatic aminotransferase
MVNEKMLALGKKRSVIRELFEFGKRRAAEIGAENVFDFSLGNPSVPAPPIVNETVIRLLNTEDSVKIHGYTSAPGDLSVRKKIAEYLTLKFGIKFPPELIYMTSGAAASLAITLNALAEEGDEVVAFAPYFPEYKVFAEAAGMKFVVSEPDKDLQIDPDDLKKRVGKNTKAVIINSPNNPSGVVYPEKKITEAAEVLKEAEKKLGRPIYLVTDEPYRELVYGGLEVPFVPEYYKDSIVCYSFSKSLSVPGERIGYVAVSPEACGAGDVYASIAGAGRALGYVCAPALFQRVAAASLGHTSDISVYEKNRDLLVSGLTALGYECVKPDGAFYLFIKSPIPDANEFSELAKKFELLLVPGDDFGAPGYLRIAYCVDTKVIEKAMPAFRKLKVESEKWKVMD